MSETRTYTCEGGNIARNGPEGRGPTLNPIIRPKDEHWGTNLDPVIDELNTLAARIAELEEQNKNLLDLDIQSLNIERGKLDARFNGNAATKILAASFGDQFRSVEGAENFITMNLTDLSQPDPLPLEVTIRRVGGKSAADVLGEPRARIASLESELKAARVDQGLVMMPGTGPTVLAAPEGHILDDKGVMHEVAGKILDCTGEKAVVRQSLSPLMTTLDGWIVQDGDWVHHNGSAYLVTDGKIPVAVQLQSCGAPCGWRDITAGECYAVDPMKAAEAGRKGQ